MKTKMFLGAMMAIFIINIGIAQVKKTNRLPRENGQKLKHLLLSNMATN